MPDILRHRMSFDMAHLAQRNNVKVVFWGVTVMMVISCLFGAMSAFQGVGPGQLARFKGAVDSRVRFGFFWVTVTVYLYVFMSLVWMFFSETYLGGAGDVLALFALSIVFTNRFAVLALAIFCRIRSVAYLARMAMAIFPAAILAKFRNKWFDLLAMTTFLCYDLLRHVFLLIRKICLEPITARTVVGSFQYIRGKGERQVNLVKKIRYLCG